MALLFKGNSKNFIFHLSQSTQDSVMSCTQACPLWIWDHEYTCLIIHVSFYVNTLSEIYSESIYRERPLRASLPHVGNLLSWPSVGTSSLWVRTQDSVCKADPGVPQLCTDTASVNEDRYPPCLWKRWMFPTWISPFWASSLIPASPRAAGQTRNRVTKLFTKGPKR